MIKMSTSLKDRDARSARNLDELEKKLVNLKMTSETERELKNKQSSVLEILRIAILNPSGANKETQMSAVNRAYNLLYTLTYKNRDPTQPRIPNALTKYKNVELSIPQANNKTKLIRGPWGAEETTMLLGFSLSCCKRRNQKINKQDIQP